MVGVTGVEPATLRLSSACSNQLSYTPESTGGAEEIRTPDILLAKQTLYQLSYSPKLNFETYLQASKSKPCNSSRILSLPLVIKKNIYLKNELCD